MSTCMLPPMDTGVKIPSEPHSCGLEVDEECRTHEPGGVIVFDDSKLHRAFNKYVTALRLRYICTFYPFP